MDLINKQKIELLKSDLNIAIDGFKQHENTKINTLKAVCEKHGEYNQHSKSIILGDKELIKAKTKCPECLRLEIEFLEKQQQENLNAGKSEKIKKLILNAGIAKRFINCSLDNYKAVNPRAEKHLKICKRYVDKWQDRLSKGGSLAMMGNCGTGKNHLATAIVLEVIKQYQNSALMTSVTKIIREFRKSWAKDSSQTEQDALNHFIKPDLLVIDEVGVQYGSDSEKIILFEVINSRYEEMKPTIIISNEDRANLAEFLGVRVMDRLRDGGGCELVFDWESYRA